MDEIIDFDALINRAKTDFPFWYPFGVDIPANDRNQDSITISSDGDFWCQYITGQYTTKIAGPVDGGANGISIKLSDNGWNVPLFNGLIPISLFLSPGRVRVSGVAGDPSHQLFYPIEFDHVFLAKSTIEIEWASNLDFENRLDLCFMGRKIRKQFNQGATANEN